MDRRGFVIGGLQLATAATVLRPAGVLGAIAAERRGVRVARVIHDSRYPLAEEFAVAARRQGLPVTGYAGDLTAAWRDVLEPHWAAAGGPVAGLTTWPSLQCLAQLARDHWYRVRLRIEHERLPGATGHLSHRLEGPEAAVTMLGAALTDSDSWPRTVAASLLAVDLSGPTISQRVPRATAGSSGIGRTPLVSWIIAA